MKRPNKRVRLSRQARIDALDERITKLQQYPEFTPFSEVCNQLIVSALRACFTVEELRERIAANELGSLDATREAEMLKKEVPVRLALARQDYRFTAEFLEDAIAYAEAQGLIDASPRAES